MDLRDRLSRLYAGVLYDAVRFDLAWRHPFVVHREIRPLWPLGPGGVLCGPAFTCRGERVLEAAALDDTVRIRMFRSFTAGCVQVIDTGGDDSVAHFGDISGKLARRFGAAGAVIDGFTRDARIITEDQFPLFCRGIQPQDAYGRWQIVTYQETIFLSGPEGRVRVAPGDWVFGDADGVLILPAGQIDEICRLAEARSSREETVRRRLLETDDVQALYDEIGRW
jgi:regulator of RNase E activity RraA